MSEIEFRFPSEQPYAYFGVKGTPEELAAMDFELLARLYVNTQFAVLKGTVDAKDAILGGTAAEEAPPGDPGAAAQRLAEGRKPRTVPEAEEMERQAVTALAEGLGATVLSEEDAPPEKPKAPWEKPKPKPVINADDFDF